jgi:hypothetical protein
MWEPRRLTTLWAFTACYRNSFSLAVLVSVFGIREQLYRFGPTERVPPEDGDRTQSPKPCVFQIRSRTVENIQKQSDCSTIPSSRTSTACFVYVVKTFLQAAYLYKNRTSFQVFAVTGHISYSSFTVRCGGLTPTPDSSSSAGMRRTTNLGY